MPRTGNPPARSTERARAASERDRTSVGACTVCSTLRTSIACSNSSKASAAAGEAPCRRDLASHLIHSGSSAWDGATLLEEPLRQLAVPQCAAISLLQAARSSVDVPDRVVRCPRCPCPRVVEDESEDPVGVHRGEERGEAPPSAVPDEHSPFGSGRVQDGTQVIRPHVEVRRARTRSERPVPRLSNRMTLEKVASRSRNRVPQGASNSISKFPAIPSVYTRSTGPSPRTW